jgi:hypothetical protein
VKTRRVLLTAALAAGLCVGSSATVAANIPLLQISADPYHNTSSFHATEVEPDTFSFGSTIVATFQVGRFRSGGATNIGFSTSFDGGATWPVVGFLPGLTFTSGDSSPYERVSDPSVAYDAAHSVWLISSLPLLPSIASPTILVSRSTDGGRTWGNPVSIPQPPVNSVDLDKNWTACDNTPSSPFYGHCYTEFDNFGKGDTEYVSTSIDGGLTWGVPTTSPTQVSGLGGQPVVQPNGTVIVPFEGWYPLGIYSIMSTDGGATWSNPVLVSRIQSHKVSGDLRTSPLPSAEIDGAGRVYVAWQDCAFQPRCGANDIVISSSADGVHWTSKARVPIDPVGVGDHFIPGIAVDRATSGAGAHLGLSYYFYPEANCSKPNKPACQLFSGFISSGDGGATWGGKTQTSGPMDLTWLPLTSQGYMVGDYISTSFNAAGLAIPVIEVAKAPSGGILDEASYTAGGGFTVIAAGSGAPAMQAGAFSISSAAGSSKIK